jgi:hypothetical protein
MDTFKSTISRLLIISIFIFSVNIANAVSIITPQFIIEEDVMRVDTGNEQTISSVAYYQNNELISVQEGCQMTTCDFDLHHLQTGVYYLVISLNNGSKLTTMIDVE